MALMEACWKVEWCILCSSLTVNISICWPDFRSFLYGLVRFSNALNIHCTTAYNSTCSLLNIIASKYFTLLPPIWQLINCILYSSLLRRHSVSETAVMMESTDSTCIPSKVPWCEKAKGNHKKQRLDCMQDVQGFPSASPAAKPGCHDSDVVSHYLKEDDDTILQQVWSVEWKTGHTLSCNTTAQYVSLTEVSGGTAWCNTSSSGEKNTTYITFRALQLFSMQLSPCWHSRISFCNLTFQFWIMWVQPQSIHCQSASKECFSITENIH